MRLESLWREDTASWATLWEMPLRDCSVATVPCVFYDLAVYGFDIQVSE